MSKPVVRVVGLGPGPSDLLTQRTVKLLSTSTAARLRTREHPAAQEFPEIPSYDALYESAASFEELYRAIVDDLVALAKESGEVVYAVPGSPIVAEHTTELLLARSDVRTVIEPAVSVIDVACAALGQDPMTVSVRVCDALGSTEAFRGPGPLLILQTYSPEILVTVADRLPRGTAVTILHHLGLGDEQIISVSSELLPSFELADHLTSLWVSGIRTTGETMDDLVSFAKRLRAECPWDQEQNHASLVKYLLEESYEAIEALENFVRESPEGSDDPALIAHVEEELGDLLFQVVFHAELGDEEGRGFIQQHDALQREGAVFRGDRGAGVEFLVRLQLEGEHFPVRADRRHVGDAADHFGDVFRFIAQQAVVEVGGDFNAAEFVALGRVEGDDVVDLFGDHQRIFGRGGEGGLALQGERNSSGAGQCLAARDFCHDRTPSAHDERIRP